MDGLLPAIGSYATYFEGSIRERIDFIEVLKDLNYYPVMKKGQGFVVVSRKIIETLRSIKKS